MHEGSELSQRDKEEAMSLSADAMLSTVAQELHIPENELLRQGLRA